MTSWADPGTRSSVRRWTEIPDLDNAQNGPLRVPHAHVPGLLYGRYRHPREERVDFLIPLTNPQLFPVFIVSGGSGFQTWNPTLDTTTTPDWIYQELGGGGTFSLGSGLVGYGRSEWAAASLAFRPEWAIGLASTANTTLRDWRVGLIQTPTTGDPTNGAYFRRLEAGNWFAVTRAAGTETVTDTTIAGSTTPREFRIVAGDPEVRFYIDGQLRATHATNLPTVLLYPTITVYNRGGAQLVDIRLTPYMSLSRKQAVP